MRATLLHPSQHSYPPASVSVSEKCRLPPIRLEGTKDRDSPTWGLPPDPSGLEVPLLPPPPGHPTHSRPGQGGRARWGWGQAEATLGPSWSRASPGLGQVREGRDGSGNIDRICAVFPQNGRHLPGGTARQVAIKKNLDNQCTP